MDASWGIVVLSALAFLGAAGFVKHMPGAYATTGWIRLMISPTLRLPTDYFSGNRNVTLTRKPQSGPPGGASA
jgi:hypothetical protein